MNNINRIALAVALFAPVIAFGQSLKDQLVGTWKTVAIYNEQDGKKTNIYGDKPIGMSMYDKSGNYVTYLAKPDLPKFASGNRQKGTEAEYKAIMQGMVAGTGTWTAEGDTVTIKWTGSSFPNRVGTSEKRTVKIVGDEMTVTNPSASSGGTSYTKAMRMK